MIRLVVKGTPAQVKRVTKARKLPVKRCEIGRNKTVVCELPCRYRSAAQRWHEERASWRSTPAGMLLAFSDRSCK